MSKRDRRQGLSNDDFLELKAKQHEAMQSMVADFAKEHGWDLSKTFYHASGSEGCYCGCPDGPCQHEFEGWKEIENGGTTVCKHCGMEAMSHDMRFMP